MATTAPAVLSTAQHYSALLSTLKNKTNHNQTSTPGTISKYNRLRRPVSFIRIHPLSFFLHTNRWSPVRGDLRKRTKPPSRHSYRHHLDLFKTSLATPNMRLHHSHFYTPTTLFQTAWHVPHLPFTLESSLHTTISRRRLQAARSKKQMTLFRHVPFSANSNGMQLVPRICCSR